MHLTGAVHHFGKAKDLEQEYLELRKPLAKCTQKIQNLAYSTIKTDKIILLSPQISLMHKLLSIHYSIC